jgi:hypothetical protein
MHVDAKPAVAPGATWNATGTQRSFETALRDQRQRLASNDRTSSQRVETRSSASRSTGSTERNERSRTTTWSAEECEMPSAERRPSVSIASVDDSPISAFIDRMLAARWRRVANAEGAECIEVVHAATGSRFLLSRENGIWLLTIQSRTPVEDDHAIVQVLRDLFARRGLGSVDVIKG